MILDDAFYAAISPGVRRAVRWLHERDYETTDSGDGTNAAEGMECAVPYPMIAICQPGPLLLVNHAIRLAGDLRAAGVEIHETSTVRIEATYSPNDCLAIIVIFGLTDDILFPQLPEI